MSTGKDKDAKDGESEHNAAPPAEEPVGYKQPPVAHQFKKGKSGNPRGRPRKVERSYTPRQMRRDILSVGNRPTTIKTEKGVITITLVEAMILKTAFKGLSGHGPSNRLFLREYSAALREHDEVHDEYFKILEYMELDHVFNSKTRESEDSRKRLNGFRKLTRRT